MTVLTEFRVKEDWTINTSDQSPYFTLDLAEPLDSKDEVTSQILRVFKNYKRIDRIAQKLEEILAGVAMYSMPLIPDYFISQLNEELQLIASHEVFSNYKIRDNEYLTSQHELHWRRSDFTKVHESGELTQEQKYFILKNYFKLDEEFYNFVNGSFKLDAISSFMDNYLKARGYFVKELDEVIAKQADGDYSEDEVAFYTINSILTPRIHMYGKAAQLSAIFTISEITNLMGEFNLDLLKRCEGLIEYFKWKSELESVINTTTFDEYSQNQELKNSTSNIKEALNDSILYSRLASNYLKLEKYNSPLLELYEKVNPKILQILSIIFNEEFIQESLTFEDEYLSNYTHYVLEVLGDVMGNSVVSMNYKEGGMERYFYPNLCKNNVKLLQVMKSGAISMEVAKRANFVNNRFYFNNLINIDYYFWRYSQKYSVEHLVKIVDDFNKGKYTFGIFMESTYGERFNLVEEMVSTAKPVEWCVSLNF